MKLNLDAIQARINRADRALRALPIKEQESLGCVFEVLNDASSWAKAAQKIQEAAGVTD